MKKILVLNGPNLNLLGRRDATQYGVMTLKAIEEKMVLTAQELGVDLAFAQSNHEGVLIDQIHGAIGTYDGIVLNPGAFTHYSIAIRDAIDAAGVPTIEVHLSNIHAREPFRSESVIAPVCIGQVCGLKDKSYTTGLYGLYQYLSDKA